MISKVYSQNVHKNKLWTDHLLETLKDDTDIIMIQEPPHRHIKDIPSGKSKEGEPEHDTSHHSQWAKIYFNTNVSVYINNKLLRTHTLFIFPSFDPNIIAFTLQSQDTLERFNFINCYNDPSKSTIQALGDFLEREELPQLVLMGDFNLHSPKWDLQVERPDAKAELLSTRTTSAGLVLLNDVDKPTWTQPGKEPSVIDLAFVHMDLYEKHVPTLEVDLDNRAADHASLSLQLNRIQPSPSLKKALPRASKPYLAFIEEAKIILTHAESYSLEETCEKISQAFEDHSIVVQEKVYAGWWTQACSDAKQAYRTSRTEANKTRWYRTMKKARNRFFNSKVEEANSKDDIWHLLKWKQPRPSPKYIQLTDETGNPIQDNNEVFNAFHQHFNGAMEDVPLPPSPPQRPERQWQDFTTQEVIDALKSTSSKSAPGPDGIGWAVWKHLALDPEAIKGILNLVRRIILTGEWPQQMKESLTVVIPKPKRQDYTRHILSSYSHVYPMGKFPWRRRPARRAAPSDDGGPAA